MNQPAESRNTVRSLMAVFAGLVAIIVLSEGTDLILVAAGIFPPLTDASAFTTNLLLLATVYRILYSVVGCYLTARLAPTRPMGHALILGIIGLLISIAGAIVMRGKGPAWYPWTLVVVALPCAWAGGYLYERSHAQKAP